LFTLAANASNKGTIYFKSLQLLEMESLLSLPRKDAELVEGHAMGGRVAKASANARRGKGKAAPVAEVAPLDSSFLFAKFKLSPTLQGLPYFSLSLSH